MDENKKAKDAWAAGYAWASRQPFCKTTSDEESQVFEGPFSEFAARGIKAANVELERYRARQLLRIEHQKALEKEREKGYSSGWDNGYSIGFEDGECE